MNVYSKFLIISLLWIIVFCALELLIKRRPNMTKNEKSLLRNGMGGLSSIFIIEFIITSFSFGGKALMSLYIITIYYFIRFLISLALIAKKHANGNIK